MAFWGVELTPGNPYKHRYEEARGRLHVSQATLGSGKPMRDSIIVQCNVGDKRPVLLCSLLPKKAESCSLNLEFEEDDDVVFSVIGPRSVHLTGFFLGPSGDFNNRGGDDSDSYGEDIAETDTDQSSDYDSEDEYEDDFIDDNDGIEMFASSPRPKSGVTIEEIIDDEKPENGSAASKCLKKKYQLSGHDSSVHSQKQIVARSSAIPVLESEDEDGFPVSATSKSKFIGKKASSSNILDEPVTEDSSKEKTKEDDSLSAGLKRKIDAIKDGELNRGANQLSNSFTPSDDIAAENGGKLKKKKKEKNKKGKIIQTEELAGEEATNVCKNDELNDVKVDVGEEKIVHNDQYSLSSDETKQKFSKEEKVTDCTSLPDCTAPESSGKLQTRKKNKAKGKTLLPEVAPSAEMAVYSCSENGSKLHISNEATTEPMVQDPTAEVQEPNPKLLDIKTLDTSVDPAGDGSQKEGKKKRKKKSKTQQGNTGGSVESSGLATEEAKNELIEKNNEQRAQARPSKPRTFSNGLVIEEISMGKPDGRKASPGNKVSVHYIGKLKKNGEIFDSNVGRRPFKFRLGVGQVIKGWDVGVSGMRVGDKRRLTIPPSMGYGGKGAGKIPPNAWLVFDVELADVQ